jgi:hypothetical protein
VKFKFPIGNLKITGISLIPVYPTGAKVAVFNGSMFDPLDVTPTQGYDTSIEVSGEIYGTG